MDRTNNMRNASTVQGLNPEQYRAATHLDGPLLILAGAGSGKTRVLTNRIAWLISEQGAAPWSICAITFTNKAAGEMRERVERMVGFGSEAVHVATFHSTCVRILRRFIDRIGYQKNFDIYDTDDTKSLMKDICRQLEVNTKLYKEKMFLGRISHLKDELVSPAQFREEAQNMADREEMLVADVYSEYQRRLHSCNALDFDDLICLAVRLFRENSDVLEYYQDRWKYLMVDEYQDTNRAQFVLVSLLAQKYRNLCVVGDDDQSIYRFRGADIGNILNFEKLFPECEVIRLEQNYRSTQNILDAANSVIANNTGRKEKRLWTDHGQGEFVNVKRFSDAAQEAKFIADDLARQKRRGTFRYGDSAVLYRTNAQSRAIEEQLLNENIPYTIIGGTNFYARREIKDILSYLRAVNNSNDDVAVKRIINVPKRGIGATSISRVEDYALKHDMSFFGVARMADKIPGIGRGGLKIREFVKFMKGLETSAQHMLPSELINEILNRTKYVEELRLEGTDEALDRIQNIEELLGKAATYEQSFRKPEEQAEETSGLMSPDIQDESENQENVPTLQGFLEEVALVADIDSFDGEEDRVPLMTLHSAKGLEFENVYIAGMDDGLFPSYHSTVSDDSADLEEERRLCYVGITRAKKRLTLTGAGTRMLRGQFQWYSESRFIDELPKRVLGDRQELSGKGRSGFGTGRDSSGTGYYGFGSRASGTGSVGPGNSAEWKRTRKKTVPEKPFYLTEEKASGSPASSGCGYDVGDTVRHVKFGTGVVTGIRDGGRDKEVTVDFEKFGVKKMFAGFAKLVKV